MSLYRDIRFPARPDRPYVFINMVATLDGKAVDPANQQAPSGGKHDREAMLDLRAHADALLYGATTGKDVPPEEFLDSDFQAARKAAGRDPLMKFVLLSHGGHLADSDKIFGNPDFRPIVYVPGTVDLKLQNADVRQAGSGDTLDLTTMMRELKERDGVDAALCEGGPSTNSPLLAAGLIDEFFVTVTPKIFGGKPIRTIVEGELLPPEQGKLKLVSATPAGDEVFLRYRVSP